MMRFGMPLGWLLEGIFNGFWDHLGRQVGAKLASKIDKKKSKMASKKEVEIKRGDSLFGGIVEIRGPTGRGI